MVTAAVAMPSVPAVPAVSAVPAAHFLLACHSA